MPPSDAVDWSVDPAADTRSRVGPAALVGIVDKVSNTGAYIEQAEADKRSVNAPAARMRTVVFMRFSSKATLASTEKLITDFFHTYRGQKYHKSYFCVLESQKRTCL